MLYVRTWSVLIHTIARSMKEASFLRFLIFQMGDNDE
jgi:hypothetical protein